MRLARAGSTSEIHVRGGGGWLDIVGRRRLSHGTTLNLIAGAVGGASAGKASPKFDLGMVGNLIAGAVGGGGLGQIVSLLIPPITTAAQRGDLTVWGVITQLIGGDVGGAVLTMIIGLIKNRGV